MTTTNQTADLAAAARSILVASRAIRDELGIGPADREMITIPRQLLHNVTTALDSAADLLEEVILIETAGA